jgi:hypothetical protein
LTGAKIYFLRQFGVQLRDLVARASPADAGGMTFQACQKVFANRLRTKELHYRENRGGFSIRFRANAKHKLTRDAKAILIGLIGGRSGLSPEQCIFVSLASPK